MKAHRLGLWLCLAILAWPAAPLWAAPQVQETVFAVTVDRKVRNAMAFYADGAGVVIHVFNNGNAPEQLIDGTTGRPWPGSLERLNGLRRAYEYASTTEQPGSYLLRMGCGEWSVCTSLEGANFVVMARAGPAKDQIQFRVLNFDGLMTSLEDAMAGRPHTAPNALSAVERAGVEELARGSWRARLKDGLRGVSTAAQFTNLHQSPWLKLLAATDVLSWGTDEGVSLQREAEIAACRTAVMTLRPALARGEADAAAQMSTHLRTCRAYYIHVVDWLMEVDRDQRQAMSRVLASSGSRQRDEDMLQLSRFLAGLNTVTPSTTSRSDEPSATGTPTAGTRPPPRPKDSGPRKPAPPEETPRTEMLDRSFALDPAIELAAINAVPNQIVLLSFTERGGLATPDASSLSGTVFRATVADGEIGKGAFRIEALNNPKASPRMSVGRYRVKLRVKLFVARVDRCVKALVCMARPAEVKSSKNLVEVAEFDLRPDNSHRDARLVKFGPLKPPDGDDSSIYQSQLTEVRLVIELDDRIKPN